MSKLGVALVHGMGNQGPDFADAAIEEIRSRIRDFGKNPSDVSWKSVHWGGILAGRENELWRRLSADHDLDHVRIRRDIVISGLGDAIVYQGPAFGHSTVYRPIHEKIAVSLTELRNSLDKKDKAPLVFIAHSLGGVIVSNYIWDAQRGFLPPTSATTSFSKAETLSGLIRFGCNIPLFTLSRPLPQNKTIKFPGVKSRYCFPGTNKTARSRVLKWNNYFDADDILGYPLKPINSAYDKVVNKDIQIQTGTILGAHTGYWTDNDFTRPVAKQLVDLLELLGV